MFPLRMFKDITLSINNDNSIKIHVKIITPKGMLLGDGAFGKWLGHEEKFP